MTVDEAIDRLNDLRDSMVIDSFNLTINIQVNKALKPITTNGKIKFIEDVLSIIENEYGITLDQIKSKSRVMEIVEARHTLFYLLRTSRYDLGVTELGVIFNRDHTTIIHGVKTIKNQMQYNLEFRQNIEKLLFKMSILL